jgi:hypothetical protein
MYYNSLLTHRFWGLAAATIEETLRLYGSKTRFFCPSESKATRIKASLSSPAVETPCPLSLSHGFLPYSLRLAWEPDGVGR